MGMIHEEEELFTSPEAAKLLKVHPATISKLAKTGAIVRRKLPKRLELLVTADSVRAYKEARHLNITDVATRLLLLEQKIDMLIAGQAVARDDGMLSQIAGVFEKNHPHMR